MAFPSPSELLARIRSLPAAPPLLGRLGDEPGVYLVGGALRDLLLGAEPLDLDVVVEGDAIACAERLGGELRLHGRFGTCTVRLDGRCYDFATARRERYPRPGALPEVEPAPIAVDLERRDFTVNALAAALTGAHAGEVLAVVHAEADLAAGRLRVLHDRSFVDDPTRLLRLARYAARLGFEVEPGTLELARAAIGSGAIATVSGERIGHELRLLAGERAALAGMTWLAQLELDRAIHPRFGLRDPVVVAAALELLPDGERPDRLVLAAACRELGRGELLRLLDTLTFGASDRDVIVRTAREAPALAARLAEARSPAQIADAVAGAPSELVALAGVLGPRDAASAWLERLRHIRLEIGGEDLLAAGIAPGPAVGRGLRAALAAKLDGQAPDRQAELARALRAAGPDGAGV